MGIVDNAANKARFIELCKSTQREGMNELLAWLEKTDFFVAPASTRFHGAYEGGLLQHSLNVYDEFKRLQTAYPEIEAPEDSVIVSTLFHDFCKINMYASYKRNVKNEETGKWEQVDAYKHDEKFCFGGHGSKSVYLVQHFIKLEPREAVAINCHMSCWQGDTDVGSAFESFPFAWLVHVADEGSSYLREKD